MNKVICVHRQGKSSIRVIVWQHGEAWAVRTRDWSRRMYGFETREMAKQFVAANW